MVTCKSADWLIAVLDLESLFSAVLELQVGKIIVGSESVEGCPDVDAVAIVHVDCSRVGVGVECGGAETSWEGPGTETVGAGLQPSQTSLGVGVGVAVEGVVTL